MKKRQIISLITLGLLVSVGIYSTIGPMFSTEDVTLNKRFDMAASVLDFSTYIGGNDNDDIADMVIDSNGDIYITGTTGSADFPTTEGAFDRSKSGEWYTYEGFVMKLSADGQEIIYSTFLGGVSHDFASAIEVDEEGCAYVVGTTRSNDFPIVNAYDSTHNSGPSHEDCFVTKLSADGSEVLFSTFVGGSGDEGASSVALDDTGCVVVVGETTSSDFPVITTNNQSSCHSLGHVLDAFVFKLSNDGSELVYSMYLGGMEFTDGAHDVAIDNHENAIVVGWTGSSDFLTVDPLDATLNGTTDAFITKVNATGHIIFSTFYGGTDIESAYAVSFDDEGRIYVSGRMLGGTFPIVGVTDQIVNGTRGVFLLVMDSLCSEVIFSGVLRNSEGTGDYTFVGSLIIVSQQEVWIAGSTEYSSFPTTYDAIDRNLDDRDGFIVMIDPMNSTLRYSTFYGGTKSDYIGGLAITEQGYIVGVGGTESSDLPTLNALEPDMISSTDTSDGFVFRMRIDALFTPETLAITVTAIGVGVVILVIVIVIVRKRH